MTDPRSAYRRATELDPRTAQLLRAETRAALGSAERRPWGLLLAATVALAVAGWSAWARWPDPDAPASLPLDHVALEMGGEGKIAGTRAEPVIEWTAGTLQIAVTPNRGVHLTVATPEATVRVVGTRFSVERAREATTVAVSEGTVHLTCAGGAEQPVTAGQSARCLPVDPGSVLLRLTELADAPPDEVLETAAAGLATVDRGSPVWPELLARQVSALRDAGRIDEALGAARQYLAVPGAPRRAEMLAFVARTAWDRGGCAALDALEAAAAELPPGPETVLLASCLAPTDPVRARALLDRAEPWATGPWRASVDALRARLGTP